MPGAAKALPHWRLKLMATSVFATTVSASSSAVVGPVYGASAEFHVSVVE
jgi:hypothetical protein